MKRFILVSVLATPLLASADNGALPDPGCFHERYKQNATSRSEFRLARAEIEASTLEVFVNGASAGHTYQAGQAKVIVTNPGPTGSIVELSYCLPAPGCTAFDCDGTGI